jgi:transcriptional regulator with XRE-family HTH domain
MISRLAVERETDRRMRRLGLRIGEEIRRLRLEAGVSLRQLAAVTGLDGSHIARIEKGQVQASITALTSLSVALGADLNLRFFAGSGPRIHDRFQAPMLEALVRALAPCWLPRLEVTVPGPVRGVADIVLDDRTRPQLVVGEAQSEFRSVEQQLRWIGEKTQAFKDADDGGRQVGRLLIVRSTDATREVSRRYAATLTVAYPARTADVVDALARGTSWPGDGIVWMRLERGAAELLPRPPRGVPVGR